MQRKDIPRASRATPARPFGVPLAVPTEALAAGPWEDIGYSRLSAAAASVSFASIPAAFVMFRLVCELAMDGASGTVAPRITLNNDSGANYARQTLVGDGATVSGARDTAQTYCQMVILPDQNTFGTFEFFIAKPIAGAAALLVGAQVAQQTNLIDASMAFIWSNTADLINRIDVVASSGNFNVGSLFILQGSRF